MMKLTSLDGNITVWVSYKHVIYVSAIAGGCKIALTNGHTLNVDKSSEELIELLKSF